LFSNATQRSLTDLTPLRDRFSKPAALIPALSRYSGSGDVFVLNITTGTELSMYWISSGITVIHLVNFGFPVSACAAAADVLLKTGAGTERLKQTNEIVANSKERREAGMRSLLM
jgi:hypothetical protein